MNKAFTMIELIFVIVIIGILAAVAIPKLSVARDDAKLANEIVNARTCYSDMQAYYTSKSNLVGFSSPACDSSSSAVTVISTLTLTAGSEKLIITGAPASININGTYTEFKGTNVVYN